MYAWIDFNSKFFNAHLVKTFTSPKSAVEIVFVCLGSFKMATPPPSSDSLKPLDLDKLAS